MRAIILAGFPPATLREVKRIVENRAGFKWLGAPAPSTGDHYLYGNNRNALVRGVSEFAIRRHVSHLNMKSKSAKTGGTQELAPTSIFLLYVPSLDVEQLLASFDFFVFPLPLGDDPQENHWRRSVEASSQRLNHALDVISSNPNENLQVVRARVPSGQNSALKLPALNYQQNSSGFAIRELFRLVRSGTQDYTEPDQRNPRRRKLGNKKCFVDARNLFFPPDMAPHGLLRDQSALEGGPVSVLCRIMNGLYRFGHQLRPGYHFDVQRDGANLDAQLLCCSTKGEIRVSGRHANVYPNDFVRAE